MSDLSFNPVQQRIFAASEAARSHVCIHSKTSGSVRGFDRMDPIVPGHVVISRWDTAPGDAPRLMGTASAYPASMADNFLRTGMGSDIHYDDPRDVPSLERYPFQHCAPVVPGGWQAVAEVAERFGDYQFASNNCVDFGVGAFEAATQQCLLGVQRETVLDIGSPREVGDSILAANGYSPWIREAQPHSALDLGCEQPGLRGDAWQSLDCEARWTSSQGDSLSMGAGGPSAELFERGFDFSLLSGKAGFSTEDEFGFVSADAELGLGLSGGIYTGQDSRWGVDVPVLGGLVVEHVEDRWCADVGLPALDLTVCADTKAIDSAGDYARDLWSDFGEWF